MKCISYKKGYKYQLKDDFSLFIDIRPDIEIVTEYLFLSSDGVLTIKNGYAWDGASGPAIDTRSIMRGALVHDALYQLMREGELDRSLYKDIADRTLYKICLEDGMFMARAWWIYLGVKVFGKPSTDPANEKQMLFSPKGCEV
ncbi:hypothetical protein C4K68_07835 [Pokkaliibacter plantistimulans]|uniref:DUF1353 domain-containing protein n=1 Tax=Proteobacteria bacterium 228 TaxID=2083153 RepID=A0A2S5KT91_9PROT|nr:DUF1353 domain-containing protein [Pokkaliibacter plantistimulans]PPC77968.1 hypothetical protein C4K68_07835 [Pokkaliibacter plantistimulans]